MPAAGDRSACAENPIGSVAPSDLARCAIRVADLKAGPWTVPASPRRQTGLPSLRHYDQRSPGARWTHVPSRPGARRYPEVTGPLAVMTDWEATGFELEEMSHLPCLIIPTPVDFKLNRPEPLIPV